MYSLLCCFSHVINCIRWNTEERTHVLVSQWEAKGMSFQHGTFTFWTKLFCPKNYYLKIVIVKYWNPSFFLFCCYPWLSNFLLLTSFFFRLYLELCFSLLQIKHFKTLFFTYHKSIKTISFLRSLPFAKWRSSEHTTDVQRDSRANEYVWLMSQQSTPLVLQYRPSLMWVNNRWALVYEDKWG